MHKVKTIIILVNLLIICLFGLFSAKNFFGSFDNFLQDTLLQTGRVVDPSIIIIGIDDESLKKLGRWQDWKRTYYADIINKLAKGEPAVIGVDITFSDKSGNPEDDVALVNAVRNSGSVVLAVKGVFGEQGISPIALEEPFDELRNAAATGHINTIPDPDKIVRRSFDYFEYNNQKISSFASEIYKIYLESSSQKRPNHSISLDQQNSFLINFVGKPGDFEYYSFYKVLNGDIPADYFAGKIILIGPYSYGMLDQYVTPTDYKQPMNGVEIHANIIQNFLEGNFKRDASPVVNIALVVIPGMLSFIVFYKSRPLLASMILFLLLTIYIAISIATFRILGLAVYLFYPLMLMIIIYFSTLAGKYMLELFERNRITGIFGKYVAPEVVKHIIEGGEDSLKLGGTKKEITVMFVDIRGFTPLSEKVEPDVLVCLLNEYFNVTVSSIFNFGGTLDKFIGDATMAVFNAPLSLDDHAFKAINAALEMKTKSAALEKKIYNDYGLVLRFGIGINTGEAVTGNIGTGFRMEYTAIGDTVNTAARLESNAKPGEILISSATYELVKDRVKAVFYGELNLKGKDRPFPVYKVEGLGT